MTALKKDAEYVYVNNDFADNYIAKIYKCDLEPKFEVETKDWNCDGDIYPIEGIYLQNEEKYYRDFISKGQFEQHFFEYRPIKEERYFERNMRIYKLLMQIKYDNKGLMLLECLGDKYIYKISELREIKFL